MKRDRCFKKMICLFLCMLCLSSMLPVQAKNEQNKVCEEVYEVDLLNSTNLFMSNEKKVDWEEDTTVFMTYTVQEVRANLAMQNGVMAAKDPTVFYPYAEGNGVLNYVEKSIFFEEGYTYIFRYEKTEDGIETLIAKMKGKDAEYLKLNKSTPASTEAFPHVGVWTANGVVTATLTNVRCYNEDGDNLGIRFNSTTAKAVEQSSLNELLEYKPVVGDTYHLELENAFNVAISNRQETDSKVVYMEYEVGKVSADTTSQYGLITTTGPEEIYPYVAKDGGTLLYEEFEAGKGNPLLVPGARYYICFMKKDSGFEIFLQRTYKEQVEEISFSRPTVGEYKSSYPYVSVWLGTGAAAQVSCEIKNMKCYDDKGNNLGIRLNNNNGQAEVIHAGEIEDYSKVQAVYYCKTKPDLGILVLGDENKGHRNTVGVKDEFTYQITEAKGGKKILTLQYKEGKEIYQYLNLIIRDEDGNQYKKLDEKKVTFVTGEKTFVEKANAENGYRVDAPAEPTKKGNVFKGWYLGNGKEYDFNTLVTESITLYAKWQDGDGNEYLANDTGVFKRLGMNTKMVVAITISGVILLGYVVGSIVMVKKGRKQDGK